MHTFEPSLLETKDSFYLWNFDIPNSVKTIANSDDAEFNWTCRIVHIYIHWKCWDKFIYIVSLVFYILS